MKARLLVVAALAAFAAMQASPAGAATTVPVSPYAIATPSGGAFGLPGVADLASEVDEATLVDADATGDDGTDRDVGDTPAATPPHAGGHAKSNPQLGASFDGLNLFQQRFANNGNQFTVEPPDQGLCAGNGFVVESVNDVLRVFDTSGNALTNPIDLNTFYGYSPAVNRGVTPLQFGPSITDPSCYYDAPTQRWFHVVLTLDRANPLTQGLSGANHLDIAVSNTSSPLGTWTVYHLPVQNDGTQGTPDHGCVQRVTGGVLVHGPCLGDYPHIGADRNGFYVTTNEFDLASPGRFHGSQVYALSKSGLESGAPLAAQLFNTAADHAADGNPGFTVWPAQTPGDQYDISAGGTEYFLSSDAVFSTDGKSNQILQWTLSNTSSLASASPNAQLTSSLVGVAAYGVPASVAQKPGDLPLANCINDSTCRPLIGAAAGFPASLTPTRMPANDSRMQQVTYANGKLWGALDTGLAFPSGNVQAGIAWFIVNPHSGNAIGSGYLGDDNVNYTYPALGVTSSGRGVLAFTTVGPNDYPSAGYAGLDAIAGAGTAEIAAAGLGPQDGFSGYRALVNPVRPRWGDYGAAAADGNDVWIASEYIGETCTYAQYRASGLTCGATRAPLGNWGTRISKVTP